MSGTKGKTAWRLLAAVPFVLLLAIVGIKMGAGAPSSPLTKVPGVETIYELGDDAPTTDVRVKLPKPKKSPSPSESASDEPSDDATELPTGPSDEATPTKKPTKTATSGGGTGGTPGDDGGPDPTKDPEPTPTPTLSAQEQCEAQGKHWRRNILNGQWYCSSL